ncbi:Trihelix transcription factor ASR3 [Dichanthelium oligosanthes]|uniref:Trihelix transcription factor ASR3 n=1 Tax=Dichanthelium oligosanthes TaxID=888268 RepID=A0A1E5UUT5_9POAL|nr:Trihelix transcription factor ASR3 [Dichanthelium oligosanthes]
MSSAGEARGVGTGRGSRLPRWTRQEILVLIEGKRVVERSGRGRGRGRARGGGGDGAAGAEPTKWAAVAEYCRRHGVDRGPVQCRKRWSNLAGDYKKIREWERGFAARKEASFWAMRNDARRERRLPGFFDREVYDILEGRAVGPAGNAAAAAAARPVVVDVESKAEVTAAIDGARGAEGAGLFSSSEDEDDQEDDAATPSPTRTPTPVALPIPGEQVVPSFFLAASSFSTHGENSRAFVLAKGTNFLSLGFLTSNCYLADIALLPAVSFAEKKTTDVPMQESSEQAGTSKGKQPEQVTEDSPAQCGQKRQRSDDDASGRAAAPDLQGQLVEILDRSSQMVAEQLEAQNINSRLDREQRKEQVSSLLGVLGKVADALFRIADKL